MEPHAAPPAAYSATYVLHPAQQQQEQQPNRNSFAGNPSANEHVYSEKEDYSSEPQDTQRSHRGSRTSYPPSPNSLPSAGRRHRDSNHARHPPLTVDVAYPPQARLRADPEKQNASPPRRQSSNGVRASNPDVTTILYDSGDYNEKEPEEKPVQLLLFLSGPCALLSFLITIWTIFSLLLSLLLQPFRLFSTRPPMSSQITTFLAPPLNLQLRMIYSYPSASTSYSTSMLVVIHLFSPIVAMGVGIAAWTAACFWIFTAILGDPAGQEGHNERHNDGKDSLLAVRNWWERWLLRGLREE